MPGLTGHLCFTGVAPVPKAGPEGTYLAGFRYYRPSFGDGGHTQYFGLGKKSVRAFRNFS